MAVKLENKYCVLFKRHHMFLSTNDIDTHINGVNPNKSDLLHYTECMCCVRETVILVPLAALVPPGQECGWRLQGTRKDLPNTN